MPNSGYRCNLSVFKLNQGVRINRIITAAIIIINLRFCIIALILYLSLTLMIKYPWGNPQMSSKIQPKL